MSTFQPSGDGPPPVEHADQARELTRRTFVKALGASLALAGLDGCTRMPGEQILPFVDAPPEVTPGVPLHYATSMVLDGYATGLIVESHVGRPTKIEGNPGHPASLGAAGLLEQGSLLQLYDPHRATRIREGSRPTTDHAFGAMIRPGALARRVGMRGERLAVLLEPSSSPLVADRLEALRTVYPDMQEYWYAPLASSGFDGAVTVPGLVPHHDVRQAEVILAVGSDFLASGPFHLHHARAFAEGRRDPLRSVGMNRLYVAECGYSVTGGSADHRLACSPDELDAMLWSLLATLRGGTAASPWVEAVAADLRQHAGRSLVISGERQPPRIHALVVAITDLLHNAGSTVWYTRSPLLGADDPLATMDALVARLREGDVDTLVCIGGNPCYATAGPLEFAELFRRVPNSVYAGLYENETARDADWFVPAAQYLETWGDARAYDGTYSFVQPLVRPLHGGVSPVEVLCALTGDATPKGNVRALLQSVGQRVLSLPSPEEWEQALGRGYVLVAPPMRTAAVVRPELIGPPASPIRTGGTIDVVFAQDASVYDGSFANNGWLQETPDPITKLTWDNAALLSPAIAREVGLVEGDVVELRHGAQRLRVPAIILPGQPERVVALQFGYGRLGAEDVAQAVGVNVYPFWPGDALSLSGVSIGRVAGQHHELAITQSHWTMEGRAQARSATRAAALAGALTEALTEAPSATTDVPEAASKRRRRSLTIYDPPQRLEAPQQWAMTIDLGTCTGCSACVVACQAENNIPVVGRDEVLNSREMHWMRIDRYLEGPESAPRSIPQPMLCQHCEDAPCEYVCPVGATTHSDDGLNEMVYNRCVGTRFCSNNCPYKVRRFNWYDYNADLSETVQMAKNPDVTVRERGVMEKCTFCVQRIREAEIAASVEGRPVQPGSIKTACQQTCPTNAIVFGSLTEPGSDVARLRDDPRAYSVLAELGTKPRVEYLTRIRNVNPRLTDDA